MFAAKARLLTPKLAAPSGAHYTDNFNRSNASTLGASWTAKDPFGIATQFRILGNTAALSATGIGAFGFDGVLSEYNSALSTDDHSVSLTVAATAPDFLNLYLRSNGGSEYIFATIAAGGTADITTVIGDSGYLAANGSGTVTTRNSSAGSQTITASDLFLFQAVGNVYTLKKNGSTLVSWTDSGGAHSSYVNSTHRKAAISIGGFSSTSQAVDNFTADDI